MKKTLLLLFFAALSFTIKAQDVTGRWQTESADVDGKIDENYQFFADGTFNYNPAGDDGLSRIGKISGTYKITGSKITLTALYYTEKSGGELEIDGEAGAADWNFKNAKEQKVEIKTLVAKELPFKFSKKKGAVVIEIDGSEYYKISGDPNKM